MKILLVMPYFNTSKTIITPPLGLTYVAAALEKNGHDVSVKDFQADYVPLPEAVEQIVASGYDAVGISALTENRFNAIDLIRRIKHKDPSIFIFGGGPHFSGTAFDALQSVGEIDAIVRGEGEVVAAELIDAYCNGLGFQGIRGITYRDSSRGIIENHDQEPIYGLDNLAAPAWHLLDIRKYTNIHKGQKSFVGVISSRGCPNRCVFCANSSPEVRFRNPRMFVDEIKYLNREYKYENFMFFDPTFTLNHNHVTGVCDQIRQQGLNIRWQAGARVDTVNRNILKTMKEAGCFKIGYGIESGSQKILDNISKGIKVEGIKEAIAMSSELGLEVSAYFMVSLPDEEMNDLKDTLRMIKELKQISGCNPVVGFTHIYPNTKLEEIALKKNLFPKNFSWNKYKVFPKYILTDTAKTMPYYEDKLKIETIKWSIIIANYNLSWRSFWLILNKLSTHLKKVFNRTFIQRT